MDFDKPPFERLNHASTSLGIPTRWLKAEVQQGRLPHIKCGNAIYLHVLQVEEELKRRANIPVEDAEARKYIEKLARPNPVAAEPIEAGQPAYSDPADGRIYRSGDSESARDEQS